ncbi:hypothetical protein PUNSTDRAFT_47226 [Punctularia strigosozonata HHB-11173 SS5]|uniref:Transglycosylase SLT domain-containing protein n=1 Tax=Punctularia strigosozonata (strain HHB-11173) TaxID=741275 RepID=R7S5S8_PUNST|nr:uncharacterized protein PUNSTDRAFT_47226 [Punctularia strigosozonata HHB-11173 SS5]EIN04991.1 hypothetical protein PUNSTDRAFT_47226 [Punctularia strigosozonata HHB-11173 SS5]
MRLYPLVVLLVSIGAQALPSSVHKRQNKIPSTYDPSIASLINQIGVQRGVPESVLQAAFETAWVESHINNLNFGDSDSLGVFQQRPSQGWGTAAQVQDPTYATNAFLDQAMKVYNKDPSLAPGDIAQKTQRSAYPDRYNEAADRATKIRQDVENGDPDGDEDDDEDDYLDLIDDLDDDGGYDYVDEDGEFDDGDDDGGDYGDDDGGDYGDDDGGDYGDDDGGDYGGDDGGDYGGDDGGDYGGGDCRRRRDLKGRLEISCDIWDEA